MKHLLGTKWTTLLLMKRNEKHLFQDLWNTCLKTPIKRYFVNLTNASEYNLSDMILMHLDNSVTDTLHMN